MTTPMKKQVLRRAPPRGQIEEDRRAIIRLEVNHGARKTDPFQLRQIVQNLVPEKILVLDVWTVPTGIAIIAPKPTKSAAIMEIKGKFKICSEMLW